MKKNDKNIWFEKNAGLRVRSLQSDDALKSYEEKQRKAYEAAEYVVKKSVVDYYSLKVPFSSI